VKDSVDRKTKAFRVHAINLLGFVQLWHPKGMGYQKDVCPWTEGSLVTHTSAPNTDAEILLHEELLGQQVAYHSSCKGVDGLYKSDEIYKVWGVNVDGYVQLGGFETGSYLERMPFIDPRFVQRQQMGMGSLMAGSSFSAVSLKPFEMLPSTGPVAAHVPATPPAALGPLALQAPVTPPALALEGGCDGRADSYLAVQPRSRSPRRALSNRGAEEAFCNRILVQSLVQGVGWQMVKRDWSDAGAIKFVKLVESGRGVVITYEDRVGAQSASERWHHTWYAGSLVEVRVSA
jgi:hypothetical protein